MEQLLLAAFIKSREAYDRVYPYIKDGDFDGIAKLILQGITDYYHRDGDALLVDVSVLSSSIARQYPRFANDVELVLENLPDASAKNVEHEFLAHKRSIAGHKLAAALQAERVDDVTVHLDEYTELLAATSLDKDENTEFTGDLHQLFAVGEKNLKAEFRFRPKPVQDFTGGGDRGDHILIFGRPNSGKSLFTINLVSGWLHDGHKVLYIGNEDRMERMLFRFICRLSNQSSVDLKENPQLLEQAIDKAAQHGMNNLVFKSLAPGTFKEIETLAKRHNPDIIVIDQIRNLQLPRVDGLTAKLELAAMEARNLAKRRNALVVSITQAGDSATNRRVLTMEDIDSSKTGLQAALDLMIGIGADKSYTDQNMRMINLLKNKLGGEDKSFPARIDPYRSKIGVMK